MLTPQTPLTIRFRAANTVRVQATMQ
ncbi:MAG: hypothetical protein AVDCRST_MAG93-2137, partial [uncultured Chloroflexia bacterium]